MAEINVPCGEYRIGYDSDDFILDVKPNTNVVIFRSVKEKAAGLLNCDIDTLNQEKAWEMYSELQKEIAGADLSEKPDSLELVVVSRNHDSVVAFLDNYPVSSVEAYDLTDGASKMCYQIDQRDFILS